MVSDVSADSLLFSKVVDKSFAARWLMKNWACSLVPHPANLLSRHLCFSKKILSMEIPSKKSLSMVVDLVLHAIVLILSAQYFEVVLRVGRRQKKKRQPVHTCG